MSGRYDDGRKNFEYAENYIFLLNEYLDIIDTRKAAENPLEGFGISGCVHLFDKKCQRLIPAYISTEAFGISGYVHLFDKKFQWLMVRNFLSSLI